MSALGRALGVKPIRLAKLAEQTSTEYRRLLIPKQDGDKRECWAPSRNIRDVQARLVRRLLRRVEYPYYLHGGLPKRDYVSNANAHIGLCWGFCTDIEAFYPSITYHQVFDVWHSLLHFSPEVSEVLTEVTTLNGMLPQGSITASYLANLVLWRNEPNTVDELQKLGFTYTRFVDDICISTTKPTENKILTAAVSNVQNLLHRSGFRSKRGEKERVLNANGDEGILGLSVSGNVGRSKRHRNRVAQEAISAAGIMASMNEADASAHRASILGKLRELRRFHVREADRLQDLIPS